MKKTAKPQLCKDRVVPFLLRPRAAELAIAENPANGPKGPTKPKAFGHSAHPAKIAFETAKLWKPGRVLGVRFLDGSPALRQRVAQQATAWTKYANIKFDFNAGAKAEIRVSFSFDPGSSWSAIGTDALLASAFPKSEPTMNYGWLDDGTDDAEVRRVVVHEFGHAIGAVHEHQTPVGGIQWNLPVVYKYFSGPPNNWSKAEIDFNVVQKYSLDQIRGTKFDPDSIMLYAFPPEMTLNGVGTKENDDLSAADKKFARKIYPK